VVLDGATVTVKVAHVRLCHSRMLFVRAYPRETRGRWCLTPMTRRLPSLVGPVRGASTTVRRKSNRSSESIARRTKTAVDTIFVGKDRAYNRRFQQMCSHYLIDPVACTPASGWEKGQVENQVGVIRRRFFVPRPKFKSYAELNAWLEDRCLAYAKANKHPEVRDRTIWDMFEDERSSLVPYVGPFDGFHAVPASVSKTCLVRFDNNKYSVDARAPARPVEIRAYADRLECWQDGRVVGCHARSFGRGKTIYDPLHYIPVLARKPGALRNGAPFKEWDLPVSIRRVQRKLERQPGGDRQMVDILSAVLTDGIDAVEAACAEALSHNVHSAGVVLNILARHRPTREYPKLCVWGLAHAVETGHLLNRSGYRIANWFLAATHSLTHLPVFSNLRMAR